MTPAKGYSYRFKNHHHNRYSENGNSKSSASSPKSAKLAEVYNNKLKVFVKNIPNDTDDVKTQIKELMSAHGEPLHVHYFSRRRGRNVVHLALIVMKSESAASNAVAAHGSLIEGRHVIVSTHGQYTQHPNCVYISNLSCDADEEELWQLFEIKGKILFINIKNPVNVNAVDLPLEAEVIFESKKAAEKALSLDGKELRGRPISLSLKPRDKENHTALSVHVSGLSQDVTKEKIASFFDQSGVVRMVKINFKNLSAVVHFTTKEAVDSALRLHGRTLDGHTLSVRRREEEVLNLSLENPVYLSNIPESVKDVDLFLAFQDCGYIREARFLPRRISSAKKRAIIQFQYPESITKAVSLDGIQLAGGSVRVSDSEKSFSTSIDVNEEGGGAPNQTQNHCVKKRPVSVEDDVADDASPLDVSQVETEHTESRKVKRLKKKRNNLSSNY